MLYLLSISGMRESIEEGMVDTVDDCPEELDWQLGRSSTRNKLRKMRRSSLQRA